MNPDLYQLLLVAIPALCALAVEWVRARDRQRHREALLQAAGNSGLVAALDLQAQPQRVPNSTSVLLCLLSFGLALGASPNEALIASGPRAKQCKTDADCSKGQRCSGGTCTASAKVPIKPQTQMEPWSLYWGEPSERHDQDEGWPPTRMDDVAWERRRTR